MSNSKISDYSADTIIHGIGMFHTKTMTNLQDILVELLNLTI